MIIKNIEIFMVNREGKFTCQLPQKNIKGNNKKYEDGARVLKHESTESSSKRGNIIFF
jgi:hypothetical protein